MKRGRSEERTALEPPRVSLPFFSTATVVSEPEESGLKRLIKGVRAAAEDLTKSDAQKKAETEAESIGSLCRMLPHDVRKLHCNFDPQKCSKRKDSATPVAPAPDALKTVLHMTSAKLIGLGVPHTVQGLTMIDFNMHGHCHVPWATTCFFDAHGDALRGALVACPANTSSWGGLPVPLGEFMASAKWAGGGWVAVETGASMQAEALARALAKPSPSLAGDAKRLGFASADELVRFGKESGRMEFRKLPAELQAEIGAEPFARGEGSRASTDFIQVRFIPAVQGTGEREDDHPEEETAVIRLVSGDAPWIDRRRSSATLVEDRTICVLPELVDEEAALVSWFGSKERVIAEVKRRLGQPPRGWVRSGDMFIRGPIAAKALAGHLPSIAITVAVALGAALVIIVVALAVSRMARGEILRSGIMNRAPAGAGAGRGEAAGALEESRSASVRQLNKALAEFGASQGGWERGVHD